MIVVEAGLVLEVQAAAGMNLLANGLQKMGIKRSQSMGLTGQLQSMALLEGQVPAVLIMFQGLYVVTGAPASVGVVVVLYPGASLMEAAEVHGGQVVGAVTYLLMQTSTPRRIVEVVVVAMVG
ncbi:MAG: hypothetical protein DRJ03_07500 [Chloroflexi bacterium]|nr:MAG: hypothetical protein DRJ03_07500 [Chloroflexota bacterium]